MPFSSGDTWQISPFDRANYENQFTRLNPANGFVNGAKASPFLKQSNLPNHILAQIWNLADVDQDGQLTLHEFCIAMFLIQKAKAGAQLPVYLPDSLKTPSTNDLFNFSLLSTSTTPIPGHRGSITSLTHYPNTARRDSFTEVTGPWAPSKQYNTLDPSSARSSVSNVPLPNYEQWTISTHQKPRNRLEFNQHDHHKRGYLTGAEARGIFLQSGLPQLVLAQIWSLADVNADGNLTFEEYCIAQFLIEQAKQGVPMPATLPNSLRGSVFKMQQPSTNQSQSPSLTFAEEIAIHGTNGESLGKSVGSTAGEENTALSMALKSREEERRENFLRGQEELARRQALLREQMEKEEEARRENERLERERLEKIRLEKERARQLEMEQKLEQQRKLERERAEEAQRQAEERERQRLETEKQRLIEMEARRLDAIQQEKCLEEDLKAKVHLRYSEKMEELKRVQKQFEDLQSEMESHRNVIMELRNTISTVMRQERDQLEQVLKDLDVQAEAARAESSRLQKEVDRLRLEEQRSQHQPHMEQVKALENSISSKTTALRDITNNLTAMEKELTEGGETLATQRNKLADYEQRCSRLKIEVSQSKQALEKQIEKYLERKRSQESKLPSQNVMEIAWPVSKNEPDFTFDDKFAIKEGSDPWNFNESKPFESHPKMSSSTDKNGFDDPFVSVFSSHTMKDPFADQDISLWGDDIHPDNFAQTGKRRFKANFDFTPRQADELSFKKGDVIVVDWNNFVEGQDWLVGSVENTTQEGLFPLTFCIEIEEQALPVASTTATTQAVPVTADPFGFPSSEDPFFASTKTLPNVKGGESLFDDDAWTSSFDNFSKEVEFASNFDVPDRAVKTEPVENKKPEELDHKDCGCCIALYTFESQESGDLEFTKGQHIHVVHDTGEWWKGYLHGDSTRRVGMFPSNFVRRMTAAEVEQLLNPTPHSNTTLSTESTDLFTQKSEVADKTGSIAASSLLANASTTLNTVEIVEVIAPYTANGIEQLSLEVGQRIEIRKKSDTGWWQGEMQVGSSRRIGWFPRNYVKDVPSPIQEEDASPTNSSTIKPIRPPQVKNFTLIRGASNRPKSSMGYNFPPSATTNSKKTEAPQRPTTGPHLKSKTLSKSLSTTISTKMEDCEKVISLYAFKAMRSDELSFEKGAVITVVRKDEPEWWRGRLDSTGAEGLFPVNYVRQITAAEPK